MATQILDRDDLLTLTQAAKRLPGRPHRSTLWRWAQKGIELPNGSRAYLQVRRLGRWTLVAPEDIDAFSEALTAAHEQPQQSLRLRPARTPRQSTRAQRAEAEAQRLGI
ncbi:MAG: hypothetical protein WDZ31_04230 [Phycisphaeraceae bacterium]